MTHLSVVHDHAEAWNKRRGRRVTDAPVPDTRQVFAIADAIRQLVLGDDQYATFSDDDRKAVAEITRWIPRGEDVRLALGFPDEP